jgi:hypothetical protein
VYRSNSATIQLDHRVLGLIAWKRQYCEYALNEEDGKVTRYAFRFFCVDGSIIARSIFGIIVGSVALILLFGCFSQIAFADHINFRDRDMRTIVVGETRENPVFYGCQDKQATIELSTWIDAAPWTIKKIMENEVGRSKFGGEPNCNEHRLKTAEVLDLLYQADQKRGEDKVGRDDKVYFGTRYSSILKVRDGMGQIYYMLANQLIEGLPSEQEIVCKQVLYPVCP